MKQEKYFNNKIVKFGLIKRYGHKNVFKYFKNKRVVFVNVSVLPQIFGRNFSTSFSASLPKSNIKK